MGSYSNTTIKQGPTLALFYCQNIRGSSERDRQALELRYGKCIRLFPIPCSGRLEPLHLLRALEEFADTVFVIACPGGTCRYFEGNRRAEKRVERTREIIAALGMEPERVGILIEPKETPRGLAGLAREIWDRTLKLGNSPVLKWRTLPKG